MKIVVSLLLALSFLNCKKPNSSGSNTKDFAANSAGPNYAVVSAFLPDDQKGFAADIYNWKNLFIRKDLGVYNISMYSTTNINPNTKSTDIIQAFTAMLPNLNSTSTVVFTFSGRLQDGQLRLADGLFSFGQLVAPLKSKPGQRFYFLNDSIELRPVPNASPFIIKPGDLSFPEVVEFSAHSPVADIPANRLSVVFAGILDVTLKLDVNQRSTKTLKQFFDEVVVGTGKQATYQVSSAALLGQTLLSVTNYVGNTPSDSLRPTPDAQPSQPSGGASSYQLIEASLPTCGPCKAMAKQIAKMNLPNCKVRTLVADTDLETWNGFVNDPQVKAHSETTSIDELQKNYSGVSTFSSFPVIFIVDSSGKVVDKDPETNNFKLCGGGGAANNNGGSGGLGDLFNGGSNGDY